METHNINLEGRNLDRTNPFLRTLVDNIFCICKNYTFKEFKYSFL